MMVLYIKKTRIFIKIVENVQKTVFYGDAVCASFELNYDSGFNVFKTF